MTRRLFSRMIVVALLVVLAACDRAPQPPLMVGVQPWPGYEPLYLARELGHFSTVNLKLADYPGAAEIKQALRDRRVQLATLALEDALLLRRDVPDLKIILLLDADTSTESKKIGVLVARDEAIGQYHRELLQLLQGWRRALEYAQGEPVKAAQIMAQHEHLTSAQFEQARRGIELYDLRRNQQLMLGEPPAIGGDIVAAQRSMLAKGSLKVGADPALLVDATLLAEAVK